MPWKISDTLDGLSTSLPETLVTAAARSSAKDLLQALPNVFRLAFFEIRLQSGGQAIDFGLCIRNSSWAGRAGSKRPRRSAPPAWWDSTRERVRRHLDQESRGDRPCVWLEFDDPEARHWKLRAPGVLMEMRSARPCLDRTLQSLGLPHGIHRKVEKALAALLEGGRVRYLSFMPSRRHGEVKLNLMAPSSRLQGILEAIGHPCRGAAKEAVKEFFPAFDNLRFDLTIGEGFLPKIGFEAFSTNAGLRRRLQVLRALESAGLCPEEKAGNLRAWSGTEEYRFPGHRWPSVIDRKLGLKLVCDANGGFDAKAYLEFAPRFSLL